MRHASSTVKPTNKPIGCINDERLAVHIGNNRFDKDKINNKFKELTEFLLLLTPSDLLDLLTRAPENIQELLNKIPESLLYSQEVQENLRTILEMLHKVCLKPDVDSVVANTNKHVREHVPLSKREGHQAFIGLSRDRIAVETPRKSETIENSQFPLRLPKPLAKGEKRSKDHPEYYERWADRENKNETPLKFLERVWGAYIRAGLLYQTDLRGGRQSKKGMAQHPIDKRLFDLVSEQCRELGKNISDILPTKSDEVENRFNFIESKVSEFPVNGRKVQHHSFSYRSKRSVENSGQ